MHDRSRSFIAYLAILATAICGLLKLPIAAAVAGAAMLALLAIRSHEQIFARISGNTATAQFSLYLSTALNSVAIALLAFALGRATAWLWGL